MESQAYVFEHSTNDPADALMHFRNNRISMELWKSGGPKMTVVEVREKEATE